MNIDLRSITETRIQLHWAAQLLSAAADAKLEKKADDSHSNLGWEATDRQLVNRAGHAIDVAKFQLIAGSNEFPLHGITLDDSKVWLSKKIGNSLQFRDYEMPDHPVSQGAAFNPKTAELDSICSWFSLASQVLDGHGTVRVWPHHFDMGFWNPLETEERSIGGGFSLGDGQYDQPYFYVNPYGIEKPPQLPAVAAGHWSNHWFGAVLTAKELAAAGDDALLVSKRFIDDAVALCLELLK